MTEVFISHSLNDKNTAETIRGYLEQKGISCWTTRGNIAPGSDWAVKLNSALSSMKVFLLIYSKSSADSGQVARELAQASGRADTAVIPYRIDDTPLSGSFEHYLTGSEWISADTENGDPRLEEIYERISSALNARRDIFGGGSPKPDERLDNKPAKKRISPVIAAVCGAVLALGGVFLFMKINDRTGTEDDLPADREISRSADAASVKKDDAEIKDASDSSAAKKEVSADSSDYFGVYGLDYTGKYTKKAGELHGFSGSYNDENGEIQLEYTGGIADGKASGKGKCKVVYSNGEGYIHEGVFENGYPKGEGTHTYLFTSGDLEKVIIEGMWDKNDVSGECTETDHYTNGNLRVYKGGFKDNDWGGKGTFTMTYKDGDIEQTVLEGIWDKGKTNGDIIKTDTYKNGDLVVLKCVTKEGDCNGKGIKTYTYASGDLKEEILEGTWTDDHLSGDIVHTFNYTDGTKKVYEGGFRDSHWNGKGKLNVTYTSGNLKKKVVEGTWENGELIGEMTEMREFFDGEVRVYEGEYSDDNYNGKGVRKYTYTSGDIKEKTREGTWKDGKLSGDGTETSLYFNGDVRVFKGKFSDGNWNGEGILTMTYAPDNRRKSKITEGVWSNGKLSGNIKRTIVYSDGDTEIYEGGCSDSKYSGEGVLTFTFGGGLKVVSEGTFKDDLLYTGSSTSYDKNGLKLRTTKYQDGKPLHDVEDG